MERDRTAFNRQELDLLKAIQADPASDSVRLVYADWLEENGSLPRAELVRGQVALAGMAEDSARRRELAFRCRRLLDNHEGPWAKDLVGDCPERHWARGFIEVVGFSPQTLERNREGAFRQTPIRRLILTGLANKADALALIPPDNCLNALELINCQLDLRGLKALAAVGPARLGRLAELSMMFNRLVDSAVELLCRDPFFQALSLLRVGCNPFTRRGRDRLRDHFGPRVSFARDRYPGRLYAIGENYWYGWGDGHVQLLAGGTDLLVFDHAGNLLRTEKWPGPAVESEDDERLVALGYTPELVRVKHFRFADGMGIWDFPSWADAWDNRRHPRYEEARAHLGHWLARGNFQTDFGRDTFWFDREGLETRW
jgi:uncharacterized protein (TIGR02996 family)